MATRVLGIDPGSRCLGWGVIEARGSQFVHVGSGIIRATGDALGPKLVIIARQLREVVAKTQPQAVAIERLFYAKNVQSVLTLAHARGVAMLVAGEAELNLFEYTAGQIKQAVVGRGRAEKSQVATMVRMLLNLRQTPEEALAAVRDFDETDALAAAICHLQAADSLHHRGATASDASWTVAPRAVARYRRTPEKRDHL